LAADPADVPGGYLKPRPKPAERQVTLLQALGIEVHLIGGALEAGELDAKRAIRQGTELAASL
jgi:hypothetical protein